MTGKPPVVRVDEFGDAGGGRLVAAARRGAVIPVRRGVSTMDEAGDLVGGELGKEYRDGLSAARAKHGGEARRMLRRPVRAYTAAAKEMAAVSLDG